MSEMLLCTCLINLQEIIYMDLTEFDQTNLSDLLYDTAIRSVRERDAALADRITAQDVRKEFEIEAPSDDSTHLDAYDFCIRFYGKEIDAPAIRVDL